MPPPTNLKGDRSEIVAEISKLSVARERLQWASASIATIGACLVLCVAAMKTDVVDCTYGVTRYFEVDPTMVIVSDTATSATQPEMVKRVGGVRQTIRALQIALEMPLLDIETSSSAEQGQWWAVVNASRTILDTPFNDLQNNNFFLVQEHESNQTRLVRAGLNLCGITPGDVPEPSISTDSDSTAMRTREWKRCLPPLPSMTDEQIAAYVGEDTNRLDTVTTAAVKVTSAKLRKFRTTADVARLFPSLREVVTKSSATAQRMQATDHGFLSVAVIFNGFIAAQVHVIMNRAADPILDPQAVRSIVVTLDPRVRTHTDNEDVAMRRASHHAQQILGRAVINFDASRKLDMPMIALLTQ